MAASLGVHAMNLPAVACTDEMAVVRSLEVTVPNERNLVKMSRRNCESEYELQW